MISDRQPRALTAFTLTYASSAGGKRFLRAAVGLGLVIGASPGWKVLALHGGVAASIETVRRPVSTRAMLEYPRRSAPMSGTLAVFIILALIVVIGVALGVRTVPQGSVWTVERFGAFTRLLQPGLNLLLPLVERVGHKMNVQEIVQDIPEQAVITRDNAAVLVDGIMYYRVMDPAKAAYGAQNLVQALTSMAMTNIRSVIGAMDLDGALSGREEINAKLLVTLDHATAPWGVKVSRVELRKIEPPANLVQAMNLQMTAERERRATVARAMGEREAVVARAEGAKQATVLAAEARLEAAMRDASARERLAEAEANATRLVAAAAEGSGGEALRYFIAQKYVDAVGRLAANPSGRTLVIPLETGALAGSITQAIQAMRLGDKS